MVVSDMITFVLFCLLPGVLLIVFAPRLVALNEKYAPRFHGPAMRSTALLAYRIGGVIWILFGLVTSFGK